ncbi:unnamed protein product [Rhizoctonia solani]|uniref:NACHT domain-containing protein n=1 Tax=Rhizoctonia solani TaxID=456999 RepID=A0A8H3AHW2_9AGAM|nr:unnamed protein product [Rhizoctonia solani]
MLPRFKPKRKRTNPTTTGDQLHPGEWEGGKRARSLSRSGSPTASGASTLGTSNPNHFIRSAPSSRSPSPNRATPHTLASDATTATEIPSVATPRITLNREADGATSGQSSARKAWTGLEHALQALRITTKGCPPLRSVAEDLTSCLSIFETAAKTRKDYEDLATGLKAMVELLAQHLNNAASESITNTITGISERIRREIESIGVQQSCGGLRRVLGPGGDEEDLIRRYRRIGQLFCQLQGEASLNAWNIANEHFADTQLGKLRPATLAKYDSELSLEVNRRSCTKNTRTKILETCIAWSENPGAEKIYWMNGMAGTGKTTIAYSLCAELEVRKQLAASFFCTVTSSECREAKRIVPTIAYQLARRSTPFRSTLCKVIKEDPDIGSGSIFSQFERLLQNPLMEASAKMPDNLVVVIDALDECRDPHIVELFLGLLFSVASKLPAKFFVTSRPEPAIRKKMMTESDRLRSILYLHEIEQSLVQADIGLYLKEELAPISPAGTDIDKLATQAGKLFIYAATAVRYIRPPGKSVDSKGRLAIILAVNAKSKERMSGIDALYSVILTGAIEDDELEPEEKQRIRLALWTSICVCEPVLISTLAAVSSIGSEEKTMAALEPLSELRHAANLEFDPAYLPVRFAIRLST